MTRLAFKTLLKIMLGGLAVAHLVAIPFLLPFGCPRSLISNNLCRLELREDSTRGNVGFERVKSPSVN